MSGVESVDLRDVRKEIRKTDRKDAAEVRREITAWRWGDQSCGIV